MAIYFPIWKDKEINVGGGQKNFSIIYKGVTIYSGRAVARPSGSADVRVNDLVLSAFDKMEFPDVVSSTGWKDYFSAGTPPEFTLRVDGGSSILFNPVWDWSYDRALSYDSVPHRILSRPLRDDGIIEVDNRQVVTLSQWTDSSRTMTANYGGRSYNIGSHKTGVGYIDLRNLSYADELAITSYTTQKYKVIKSCADYVLHYMNDMGGWDSILMNGNSIPSQDYDRKKIVTNETNDSPLALGEKTYFVGITQCWELNRGNMTDGEGRNVRQVFGSTRCVLEDLNADGGNRFIPVEIDSDRCEERSFKTNGHQMVGISIVVKASQGRMRR